MKLSDLPEFNKWGAVDYIPFISIFTGAGKIIHRIYDAIRHIFDPKKETESPKSLQNRIQVWDEGYRGLIAIIPGLGNYIVYSHDQAVSQNLIKEFANKNPEECKKLWNDVPEHLKNSRGFILSLAKVNSDVLTNLPDFTKDKAFMEEAALIKPGMLKYAPELMKDREFVLGIIQKIDASRLISGSIVLKYAPNLLKDKEFVLDILKRDDIDIVQYLQVEDGWKDDSEFLLKLIAAAKAQTFTVVKYLGGGTLVKSESRPEQVVKVFKFASDALCKDMQFMSEAVKIHPELIQFVPDDFKETFFSDNQDLILSSLKRLKSNSGNSITDIVKTYRLQPLPKEVLLTLIEKDKDIEVIASAPRALLINKEFILQAVQKNSKAVDYIPPELAYDADIRILLHDKIPSGFTEKFYEKYPNRA